MIKKYYREVFLKNPVNHHIIGNKNIRINGNKNIFIYYHENKEREMIKVKTEVKDYDSNFHLTAEQQYKLGEIANEIGDACKKYCIIIDFKSNNCSNAYQYL